MDKTSRQKKTSEFTYDTPVNKGKRHRTANLSAIIEENYSQLNTMPSTSKKKQKTASKFVKIKTSKDEYYEGEVDKNFHRSGWGIYKYHNEDVFEGEFNNGLRNGIGEYRYKDGCTYKGTWARDKKNGEGAIVIENKEYAGEWHNDRMVSGMRYTINAFKKDDHHSGCGKFYKSINYSELKKRRSSINSLNSFNAIYSSSPETVSHFELDSFQSDDSESEETVRDEIQIIREIHNNWKFFDSTDYKIDVELASIGKKVNKPTKEFDVNKAGDGTEQGDKKMCICYFKYFKKYLADDNEEENSNEENNQGLNDSLLSNDQVKRDKDSIKCHCDKFFSEIIKN
jgi:hypothetical protein